MSPLYDVIGGAVYTTHKQYVIISGITYEIGRSYVVESGTTKLTYQNVIDLSTAVVTLGSALTYNGAVQTKQVSSVVLDGKTLVEGTDYTVSGNTGTNAGNYTLTITGIGDYEGSVSKSWNIEKATGSISVSPTTVNILGPAGTTSTATITYTGDGGISVASNKTSVATVSRSGNTVTVSTVKTGSATITVTMADGTNYIGAKCTFKVNAKVVLETLNSNDWSIIKAVGAAGTGANYWNVGDRKAVAVNGTVGEASLSGTYYAYIIGFNHNESIEGKGIHFMMGNTAASNGTDIAFCDSEYGVGYSLNYAFRMSSRGNNNNIYGWERSHMNTTICPAFLSALPSALQSAISACTKYSDNMGNGELTASCVTSTSANIWLLSEFEVQGAITYSNPTEKKYQKRYAYYANGNSKAKYKSTDTTTACKWWLRSVGSDGVNFCCVREGGSAYYAAAYFSYGFAPCFKVA